MEKDKKGKNADIDEQYLISMMAGGVQKDGLSLITDQVENIEHKHVAKPKAKGKAGGTQNYEQEFFRNKDGSARAGKVVYIRPEFHERLTRMVQVIGEDKISIFEYMDNVLEHHFNEFGAEITQSFNDKYKPIL
ncbi:DUF3408 domain-containing protein [Flavobacterium coralii]|uniref:DUF3408 domain-containing protein n=1 Tax=Flavobacterium coralii TaxID=2838017 RepID=UPI000C6BADCA|nr:conjugal transfer protein TraB [Flavobacterium sp.]|tara:strand:- start:33 stop:434 length:402 start_codon:yes stop_codon:yes gene_type:complete